MIFNPSDHNQDDKEAQMSSSVFSKEARKYGGIIIFYTLHVSYYFIPC